jgi:membrane protease YdiL (CAAX protease family)
MSDFENIPQSDPPVEVSNVPPTTLAEQMRLAKIPPDLRVPWGWSDVGIFLLVYIGATILFGVAAVLTASTVQHIDLNTLAKAPTVLYIELTVIAQALASVVAMLYFLLLTRIRHSGNFWHSLGWRSLSGDRTRSDDVAKYLFGGVGLSIAAFVAGLFLKHAAPTPIEEFFKTRQTLLVLMAFGILVAPLVEETIFRGFLYPVVARGIGVVPGILLIGIVFGASHASNLGGQLGQIAILVGVGIVLTWVRAHSRSVLASFLVHTAYNSMLFAGVLIQTHGLRDFPVGK